MRELGFDHQHCTFHLLLNINEELREELNQMRKEYESNLKKQNRTVHRDDVAAHSEPPESYRDQGKQDRSRRAACRRRSDPRPRGPGPSFVFLDYFYILCAFDLVLL